MGPLTSSTTSTTPTVRVCPFFLSYHDLLFQAFLRIVVPPSYSLPFVYVSFLKSPPLDKLQSNKLYLTLALIKIRLFFGIDIKHVRLSLSSRAHHHIRRRRRGRRRRKRRSRRRRRRRRRRKRQKRRQRRR